KERAEAALPPAEASDEERAFQELINKGVPAIDAFKQVKSAGKPDPSAQPPASYPAGSYVQDPNNPGKFIQVGPKEAASEKPVQGTANGKPAWGQFVEGKEWFDPETQK